MNVAALSPSLSDRRLARLSLWLALTISWFAAHVLGRVAPQMAARLLNQHAHHARVLLVGLALRRVGIRIRQRTHIPCERHRLTCRRVAGSRLRVALRKGALADRANAIAQALAAPERWIAHLARRLRRRFTRLTRLPAPLRAITRTLLGVQSQQPCAINSS